MNNYNFFIKKIKNLKYHYHIDNGVFIFDTLNISLFNKWLYFLSDHHLDLFPIKKIINFPPIKANKLILNNLTLKELNFNDIDINYLEIINTIRVEYINFNGKTSIKKLSIKSEPEILTLTKTTINFKNKNIINYLNLFKNNPIIINQINVNSFLSTENINVTLNNSKINKTICFNKYSDIKFNNCNYQNIKTLVLQNGAKIKLLTEILNNINNESFRNLKNIIIKLNNFHDILSFYAIRINIKRLPKLKKIINNVNTLKDDLMSNKISINLNRHNIIDHVVAKKIANHKKNNKLTNNIDEMIFKYEEILKSNNDNDLYFTNLKGDIFSLKSLLCKNKLSKTPKYQKAYQCIMSYYNGLAVFANNCLCLKNNINNLQNNNKIKITKAIEFFDFLNENEYIYNEYDLRLLRNILDKEYYIKYEEIYLKNDVNKKQLITNDSNKKYIFKNIL